MAEYKLYGKTLQRKYKILSKSWLKTEEAKKHRDYPKLEQHRYSRLRLHVKINHAIDQTYIVSAIDHEHENATTQQYVTRQVKDIAVPGWKVSHLDPNAPLEKCQLDEFCKDLDEVLKVKDINVRNEFIQGVMKFLRGSCDGTKLDDHLFISLQFGIEEVYICHEDVADNL